MRLAYQVITPEVSLHPDLTCYSGDLGYIFSRLSTFGYDGVELMTTDPDAFSWTDIQTRLAAYGLSPVLVCTGELGGLGYNVSDPDDAQREESLRRIFRIIDFAACLGVPINAGRIKGEYKSNVPQEVTWRHAVEGFRRICDYAKPKGVSVALETAAYVFMNFINTCAQAERLIEEVDRPNFGLMMDLFHMHVEEPNLVDSIHQYAKHLLHVHLADNNRMYPGASGLDFMAILRAFREVGYDGAFTVETRQLPDSERCAQSAAGHLLPILRAVYGSAV